MSILPYAFGSSKLFRGASCRVDLVRSRWLTALSARASQIQRSKLFLSSSSPLCQI